MKALGKKIKVTTCIKGMEPGRRHKKIGHLIPTFSKIENQHNGYQFIATRTISTLFDMTVVPATFFSDSGTGSNSLTVGDRKQEN